MKHDYRSFLNPENAPKTRPPTRFSIILYHANRELASKKSHAPICVIPAKAGIQNAPRGSVKAVSFGSAVATPVALDEARTDRRNQFISRIGRTESNTRALARRPIPLYPLRFSVANPKSCKSCSSRLNYFSAPLHLGVRNFESV